MATRHAICSLSIFAVALTVLAPSRPAKACGPMGEAELAYFSLRAYYNGLQAGSAAEMRNAWVPDGTLIATPTLTGTCAGDRTSCTRRRGAVPIAEFAPFAASHFRGALATFMTPSVVHDTASITVEVTFDGETYREDVHLTRSAQQWKIASIETALPIGALLSRVPATASRAPGLPAIERVSLRSSQSRSRAN